MVVRELIEQLQQFDAETEVMFAYDSRDYWRTMIADKIESVETGYVEHSAYHNTMKIVDQDDEDFDDADPKVKEVVRIS